jgi:hypothetical protein
MDLTMVGGGLQVTAGGSRERAKLTTFLAPNRLWYSLPPRAAVSRSILYPFLYFVSLLVNCLFHLFLAEAIECVD